MVVHGPLLVVDTFLQVLNLPDRERRPLHELALGGKMNGRMALDAARSQDLVSVQQPQDVLGKAH